MPTALGSLKLTDLILLDGEGGGGLTDTDDLDEGATNLYYTDTRARAAISVQANVGLTYSAGVVGHNQDLRTTGTPTFGGLTLGSLGGVLKAASGVVSGSATTSDLTEGSNLYYTNARVAAYLTGLSGTDSDATFLRGDNTWSNTLMGTMLASTFSILAGGGYLLSTSQTSPTAAFLRAGQSGDPAIYRYDVDIGGKHQWGGGSSGVDTNLYRDTANSLKTDDNLTVALGLNVGTGAGAATGEVRASGTLYPRSQTSSTKLSGHTHTLANNAVAQLLPDGASMNGLVVLLDQGGAVGLYTILGAANFVREISDPDAAFTVTAGTAAQWNVYWSAANARYEIENKNGASRTCYVAFLGK